MQLFGSQGQQKFDAIFFFLMKKDLMPFEFEAVYNIQQIIWHKS